MTAAVKTAPKPKAPKGKPAATPKKFDDVPETDAKAPAAKADRTGNSAYAAESVRNQVAEALAKLRDQGFTRPSISAVTGYTDSQVWRAQNRKIHTSEVPGIMAFIEKVLKGEVKPPTSGRKPKVEELQARVAEAIQLLGNEAKTAAQYRKIVDAALEVLADVVPQATPSA